MNSGIVMDVQAELNSAIQRRFNKVHGRDPTPMTTKQNRKKMGKPKPTRFDHSKSAAKKAATAALASKIGGKGSIPPSVRRTIGSKPSPRASPKSSAKNQAKEEALVQKYLKMMNVGLPEAAIRHKMVADGISEKTIEAVMSGEYVPSTSSGSNTSLVSKQSMRGGGSASALSPEEEKIAAQYRTMLKVKMPEGAVRHKMTADGVSAKIQESVLAWETPSTASVSAHSSTRMRSNAPSDQSRNSTLSPEEEEIAAQYRTMLKVKMPEGAVRHKMTADGVSAEIQESVLNGDTPATSSPSSSAFSSCPPKKPAGNVSCLSNEDEMVATQYRKMIKMRMPEGAVVHKMNKDGVPQHIQDSILRNEVPAENPASANQSSESSTSVRPPANPMAAALASSGGIGALKKTSMKPKESAPPPMPSNPLAAAIAASGGKGILKKTSVRKKEPVSPAISSNPLAAAIAASGGQRGLRKTTPVDKKQVAPRTQSTGNPLADELATRGFQSGLKKTSTRPGPPKTSTKRSQQPVPKSRTQLTSEDGKTSRQQKAKETPSASRTNGHNDKKPSKNRSAVANASSPSRSTKKSALGDDFTCLHHRSPVSYASNPSSTTKKCALGDDFAYLHRFTPPSLNEVPIVWPQASVPESDPVPESSLVYVDGDYSKREVKKLPKSKKQGKRSDKKKKHSSRSEDGAEHHCQCVMM